jgi:hypothetical protein
MFVSIEQILLEGYAIVSLLPHCRPQFHPLLDMNPKTSSFRLPKSRIGVQKDKMISNNALHCFLTILATERAFLVGDDRSNADFVTKLRTKYCWHSFDIVKDLRKSFGVLFRSPVPKLPVEIAGMKYTSAYP